MAGLEGMKMSQGAIWLKDVSGSVVAALGALFASGLTSQTSESRSVELTARLVEGQTGFGKFAISSAFKVVYDLKFFGS